MTDITTYPNSPGIFSELEDMGLVAFQTPPYPKVLILGTAADGVTGRAYIATNSAQAASEFGTSGTLIRGMYEVLSGGSPAPYLWRMGSTPASVSGIGDLTGAAGYTVETVRKDDDAGTIYAITYTDSSNRIIVENTDTDTVVYDATAGVVAIDTGEVVVRGSRATGGGGNITGAYDGGELMFRITATGTTYTAGTDGVNPSRMELFEYLYNAYDELVGLDFDYVIPMNVYLDDKNVVDSYTFSAAYIASIVSGGTYPTPSTDDDILGKVFVEEYLGKYYFFWDLNGDGDAELWPDGVGSASATTKIDGSALSLADFHEVNFAYQLARWCHVVSTNQHKCLGVIGTRPPVSNARSDISLWIGVAPTYTTRSDGTQYIASSADNGSGLLGNKFKAGKYGFRSGTSYGGFILTDTEWPDSSTEPLDDNGQVIDIGRYISIVCSSLRMFNSYDTTGYGYIASAAPGYMGFVTSLDEKNAPTNKIIKVGQTLFSVSPRLIDRLVGMGYVYITEKPKGTVVVDAPTGARPTSDFRRLTTMRIIKKVIDVFRARSEPFIGEASSKPTIAALENAIDQGLSKLVKEGYIRRYDPVAVLQTPLQTVLGEAEVRLVIVPSWELRRIRLILSLRPE